MEHDMKISPSTVRRLRSERGWPQEQLASASGLSLRTIQRVEARGIASMSSAVSLAATFKVPLIELQDGPGDAGQSQPAFGHGTLFLGLAVITVAVLLESIRPGLPLSHLFMTIAILAALVGGLITLPTLLHLVRKRQYIAVALAISGTPMVTLLAAGVIYAFTSGRVPSWPLAAIGAAGVALVVMATRELRRAGRGRGVA